MKKLILFLIVFIFIFCLPLSSTFAQDTTTFPYLKPPNHLSTSQVIKLADGELIRSATSPEDMQTLVGSIFGADTYFKDLNSSASRKELYKQVLREIVLMNVLEQDRKWLSYLTAAGEKTQLSLELLNPELMGDFFSLYRALIDNRYLLDNNILTKSLNYLKQFGRMDTKISKSWWQTVEKLKLHQNTLDKVGTTLSFTSFISSIGSITLSAMEAMNQEIAYQYLSLISQTLTDMEGQGEYFNPDFKQAIIELTKENDDLINTSFISDFTENFYYEWEKNKDTVTEKGLALFMDTTGKKIITTTLKKAGLSHAALPALAWSLSIQYSYHVIQSGFKGIDLFNRYVITSDTLFWLRKMRDYAYANHNTSSYLSLNLLDATSQLYAYQLLESLMNTTPQKLMFWKLGTRKLVLEEIASTQKELKDLFPEVPLPAEVAAKPEMMTWERTYGGTDDDWANSIIQTTDGGYVVAGGTDSKGAGKNDAWVIKLDNQGNLLWEKTYGGSSYDSVYSLIQTTDGGYVVAGGTLSKGAGGTDFWIIRLDEQGNKLWDKTYGGSKGDVAYSLIQTTDGGYVLAGWTVSQGTGSTDVWVIKLDSKGEKVWEKTFGENSFDYVYSLIQTTDGGYVLAGWTVSQGTGSADVWVIKLDNQGNMIWDKTYGGNDADDARSIIQTNDGGYAVAGIAEATDSGKRDVWVLELDELGNKVWDKTFGGSKFDRAHSLIQTTDGGYAVAGYTESKGAGKSDAWIIKLDSKGNIIWDKTYGGSDDDWARSLIQTTDGGYAVAGYTKSKGAGKEDFWVLKLDENGNIGRVSEKEPLPTEVSATEKETLKKTYALRHIGPAGGYIFHDKGSYSDGWRYLEAAPASTEWTNKQWGSYGAWIGGTEMGIGTGQSNTTKIATWLNSHSETGKATQLCDTLTEGGYSDWFLPSKDELNLMYTNLKAFGVGGFKVYTYWSSSEYGASVAWAQGFNSGSQYPYDKDYYGKYYYGRVRAARAF